MKRLIFESGSGTDLCGQDYTKAALRALNDALSHSSIVMFSALNLSHSGMRGNIMIGVQDPKKVDVEQITAEVPRGCANIDVVFGGQNIRALRIGQPSVIATFAVEAFVPDMSDHFEIS